MGSIKNAPRKMLHSNLENNFDVFPQDEVYGELGQNAGREQERPASPAMPCITSMIATPCAKCGSNPRLRAGGHPIVPTAKNVSSAQKVNNF